MGSKGKDPHGKATFPVCTTMGIGGKVKGECKIRTLKPGAPRMTNEDSGSRLGVRQPSRPEKRQTGSRKQGQ